MLKVIVCGSRDWTDREAINKRVALLPKNTLIIHGAARGADLMAKHAAALANLHCADIPAMWRNGRKAGFDRNTVMLELEPDLVIAFQRNGSNGTQDTIDKARGRGINVEVHTQNDG